MRAAQQATRLSSVVLLPFYSTRGASPLAKADGVFIASYQGSIVVDVKLAERSVKILKRQPVGPLWFRVK